MDKLPDSLLLHILDYLQFQDVVAMSRTCKTIYRVAGDEILWRNLFQRHFGFGPVQHKKPLWCDTWKNEFIRLVDEIPVVESEVVTKHTDQVLHVAFSHDGKRFATTAKDGLIFVWRSGHPVKLEYSENMKTFSWKYTQFSQFNETDTLLLVSGVLFGIHSTSGEIAIFSLKDGFQLQCRTMSKPYDIFGSWYSEMFFLSGNLHWLGHMVSKSVIWLNKASQEAESEHASVMNELYRFYNPRASSVRSLMVANCIEAESSTDDESSQQSVSSEGKTEPPTSSNLESRDVCTGNPLSNLPLEGEMMDRERGAASSSLQGGFQSWKPFENVPDRHGGSQSHSPGPSRAGAIPEEQNSGETSRPKGFVQGPAKYPRVGLKRPIEQRDPSPTKSVEDESETDDFLDPRSKWLIFTCGSRTYTPHQIGFKKINPVTFNSRIDPGPTLKERIEEYKRRREIERNGGEMEVLLGGNWEELPRVQPTFDEVDEIIDLHGHVIGMALSPDHRFLYVNSRSWPEGYLISDPLEPPPIAQQIDLHVIDLATLKPIGTMHKAHKAYTANDECFFIFLDVSDLYLASGAEDKHGYIWDRLYGVSLVKIPHKDVVNSVAFNPKEPEMLVSVSDDMTIKIWRSRHLCRKLGIPLGKMNVGIQLYGKDAEEESK